MNHIKFALDWDKLREPRFTTVRSYRKEKEEWYRAQVGTDFTILRVPHEMAHPSKGRKIGTATLRSVERIKPGAMSPTEFIADVTINGEPSKEWVKRLLAMDDALLLRFENHTGILSPPGGRR
jgi:hypothetical protein